MDSKGQDFPFNPSVSINVSCESEEEADIFYTTLLDGGSVLMSMDNYGFAKKFGWLSVKHGVTWQLELM